ncbi:MULTISPECIES: RNA-binding cell elongation regulator Jag/EloR [Peptoniphilus]|jgi:R3H domain protein|uniref:RNA-binding cell elongation regulator Jag/EloR n=1 Tax=Peptoniphilus TaxID=162289 RepID=UPI000289A873|nr:MULTISPECIES: RNA-binding cell elongation regulator Jag/EloR [Peptoniphilus]MBS6610845.1 protein jag [Peptoniphilus harei]MDU1043139.1 RNA-binding cell elongation regulator Jag/EloR [Peptoniphilus rhinitidis]MDU2114872.1 RNA-binding cell elongation regulator Jag/EloR [Peptoniphilus lacydonensis]MDU3750722.1 RNA-binding cell elongation regulator Jag/EloR [Peptoniphilus rhinitidis]MDU5377510.1 RNA-binding cell elongation regulator Jag/EloR [Peptoniphilus lacydonensis]
MNYVIKTGKSVDEAVREALTELNINKEDANIQILDEGQKGFLGLIGSKDATVKVWPKEDENKNILNDIFNEDLEKEKSQDEVLDTYNELKFENNDNSNEISYEKTEDIISEEEKKTSIEEENEEILSTAREFMTKILETLELENIIEMELEENTLHINVNGDENRLGILIGKRGVTLDSIQYILNLIVNKKSSRYIRVSLDSSGYREKRKETLTNLAEKMAKKVIKTGRSVRLEPMNSYERKIIHTALQDFEGVLTHSEGKDPFRKVVIQKERKY